MEEQLLPPDPLPEKKEEHVIADFYDGMKEREMMSREGSINKARNTLFITAALFFIGNLIAISQTSVEVTGWFWGIAIVQSGIFVALGFWTKTRPYTAILTAIIIIILYWIAIVILGGVENLWRGAIMKIVVIVYLVRATSDAKAWEELKKQT